MKKFILITLAASVAMVLCVGNKAFAAVPDGYKTHQLTGFSVSLPSEFVKADGWSSESSLSFNSNAVNVRDDGDEYLSSANINVYDMDGDIEEINDYAQNMVGSAKAMDEVCDEPIIEGNTVILRSISELDEGFVVYWRFIVINQDGKIAGGTISYYGADAKFYDGIVTPIIQSIQFK
jgi:hypothetical protein